MNLAVLDSRSSRERGVDGKVRRIRRISCRVSAMATRNSSERRKRPWRQPRHAAGYVSPSSPAAATGNRPAEPSPSSLNETTSTICIVSKLRKNESDAQQLPEDTRRDGSSITGEAVKTKTPKNPAIEPGYAEGDAMVEIDGSVMEGGGQILRNTIALSCLMQRPVRVTNIRGGRSKPGLRPQHLAGLNLIGQLCCGKLTGEFVNSTTVELWPGSVRNGDYSADTHTAGSVTLLLQVSLPCLLLAPPNSSSTLTLRGGTDADMAPPIDYIIKVFKPIAEKFGVTFDCEVKKRGFYPRGGGEVIVRPHPLNYITPATITEPGHVVLVSVHAHIAGTLPVKIVHQMTQSARQQVEKQLPGVEVVVDEVRETASSACGNGSGIIVIAKTSTGCILGGSAIGKKEEPPYKSGRMAAEMMLKAVKEGACVDQHVQDQLIIFMALAKGKSTIRTGPLSLHTKTAIHIARTLTQAVFNVRKLDGGAHLIECDGMGLQNVL